ncbi:RidA family protein [Cellulomonas marina]|uniref:Enamine deaminase RidA, house cleaning of reactive enamine intermediates, YjgF/YER057c/UK114 family n=1 Tax=Cellulomonas marina TaxID=988821 RepID=A0A1I0WV39_9CELL|nr:RidA family protein [Cellulomonas marina]GIG30333.1 LysR family transcriptional regulator [Cellulomonas marina]SFA92028.1 Enamine deaminase RidA, house cleaning of reactive enamine intermediates, YjgF/YER057c/UK114 family [Cellulomonas marina]
MPTAAERLAATGLVLPAVAAPVAAYVPAVRTGLHVHTSGQLPFVDGALPRTGKVGEGAGLVEPAVAADLARTAALNALAAVAALVEQEGGPGGAAALDRVARVVKVVGFVASDPAFAGQPAVVNGASTLLHEVLGEAGVHARSAVGVAVLPLDSPVEVELVVELHPA